MKKRPSILILTGSFGHGHNTAAYNLEKAFRHSLGPEAHVEVVDFFSKAFPKTNALLRKGYGFAINSAPGIWKQIYRLADSGSNVFAFKFISRKLERFLTEKQPCAVVSVFPFFPLLVGQGYPDRATRPFPFFTVVTDAITINAIWCQGQSDLLFVTDDWSKQVVVNLGMAPGSVRAHGFPLRSWQCEDEETFVSPSAENLRILYLPTTRTAHVQATLNQLLPWCQKHHAKLTVVLGNHQKRLSQVIAKAQRTLPDSQLTVHGWHDDVPGLMRQHHLTLTKAGGATVSEALGAECPLLVNYVVPGQEEGNAELMLKSDCGRRIEEADELPKTLTEILIENDASLWQQFRHNLQQLNRAQASQRIVEDVLESIQSNVTPN